MADDPVRAMQLTPNSPWRARCFQDQLVRIVSPPIAHLTHFSRFEIL